MASFKEIVTKAVIGKAKKTTTSSFSMTPSEKPDTVLGCWVINHSFRGRNQQGEIEVSGEFDVNVWYSYDNDTKTTVSTSRFPYSDHMKIHLKDDKHLKIDYDKVKNITIDKLKNMKYIDIWEDLELEDYYRTDLHWKQENLQKVVKKLQTGMNKEIIKEDYIKIDVGDFYGTYYGQLGMKIKPDKMYILTNELIENCKTYNYETKNIGSVYDKSTQKDKYDIYLSGATPLIYIENPNANTEKELLLFRDSYGSSIAPLLIQNYRKITLIDLRYISSTLLENYIEFDNQDVLFLYSILVLSQNILQ